MARREATHVLILFGPLCIPLRRTDKAIFRRDSMDIRNPPEGVLIFVRRISDSRPAPLFRRGALALLALLLCALLAPAGSLASGHLDFTLHKLGPGKDRALLVIAGIQGDEPGGFNAANLLVSRYRITQGAVWVVPNLNFPSIVRSLRGLYGDMNRKFAAIKTADPDFETVRRIKAVIQDPRVDMILNMHDGSGYYRHDYVDSMRNPLRWGQSVIIDQAVIPDSPYGNLLELANMVCDRVNRHLADPEHVLHVKNTKTRLGDVEMEKTLTYFAINRNKAAFGLEASKSFSSSLRCYYHLQMIESFMDAMGIRYERPFPMTLEAVDRAMQSNVAMAFYGNKIFLDLQDVRDRLGYVPLREGAALEYSTSNPLLTMVGDAASGYDVYYGNQRITHIHPQYFAYDYSLDGLVMEVDGEERRVPFGAIVSVADAFSVRDEGGCRVNAIGYTHPRQENETGLAIRRQDFMPRFSVDKAGDVYRVEAYKDGRFVGMVLVRFGKAEDVRLATTEIPPVSETAVRRKMAKSGGESTAMIKTDDESKSR